MFNSRLKIVSGYLETQIILCDFCCQLTLMQRTGCLTTQFIVLVAVELESLDQFQAKFLIVRSKGPAVDLVDESDEKWEASLHLLPGKIKQTG